MDYSNSKDSQEEVGSLLSDVLRFKEVRNRRPLSCLPCRQRKESPCGNCSKKQQIDACVYAAGAAKSRPSNREAVKLRVKKLEEKIKVMQQELQTQGSSQDVQDSGTNRSNASPDQDSTIMQQAHNSAPLYWEAILGDITDIRNYLEDNQIGYEDDVQSFRSMTIGQSLPEQSVQVNPKHNILSAILSLPPRPHMDKLIAHFFDMAHLLRPVTHPKQFQREYNQFWRAPANVSRAWLGLLFAILRTAAHSCYQQGEAAISNEAADEEILKYRRCALENLDFQPGDKSCIHMIQGMLTHLEAEAMKSMDSDASVFVSSGKVVRLALLSGLHRDPSALIGITPFMAEMRRRLWLCVVHCDILMSAQVGLPSMIPFLHSNTKLPRNIRNDDFDEDTTELPPQSPGQLTNVAFPLAKNSLVRVFGRIVSSVQDERMSLNMLTELHRDLHAAWEDVPAYYHVRPSNQSLTDPSYVIMRRYAVEQIYLTSVCLLHRRHAYLHSEAIDSMQDSSLERSCVDAAIKLLGYQVDLHKETQPSGRLSHLKIMALCLTKNDYLLAAVLICLELNARTLHSNKTHYRELDMLTALENSYHVWKDLSNDSTEALKASEILLVMLTKLRPIYKPESLVNTQPIPEHIGDIPECFNGSSSDFPYSDLFFTEPEAVNWNALDRWIIPEPPLSDSWAMNLTDQSAGVEYTEADNFNIV